MAPFEWPEGTTKLGAARPGPPELPPSTPRLRAYDELPRAPEGHRRQDPVSRLFAWSLSSIPHQQLPTSRRGKRVGLPKWLPRRAYRRGRACGGRGAQPVPAGHPGDPQPQVADAIRLANPTPSGPSPAPERRRQGAQQPPSTNRELDETIRSVLLVCCVDRLRSISFGRTFPGAWQSRRAYADHTRVSSRRPNGA